MRTRRARGIGNIAGAAAACAAAAAAAGAGAAYFPPPFHKAAPPPPPDPGEKRLALAALRRRCRFTVWAPGRVPAGYRLRGARIAWVVRDGAFPKLPPRQAVCLTYADDAGRVLWVVEARHLGQTDLHANLNQVLTNGYFLADLPAGSQLAYGTRRGVDYVLVAAGLSLSDLSRAAAAD